ncbi:Restriction endonuclease S subunits [[Eubacterium] siraeum 70/3]|uniref:Restriction endonuclease S subunits n=1 Tax=[Eubacterium] siraeum 70/3 TaxID=657319 RepID=D4JT02_9FIRM|nr:Restriction endonuclease S subunits [[Eubacterium] siraeum 70/3]
MKSDKTTPNVPTLRFKQYHCPWSTYHLSDIAEVVGGGTPDTTVSSLWNGDIQWFTPTEVGHQKYVSKSARTITQLGLQKSSAKKLPAGSILLSSRATIGECSIAQRECTTNQGFQNLIPKKDTNNEFLYYLAQTKKHHFIKYASGSTFLEISNSEIKKTKCTVPGTEEQTQIAAFLSALDDRIAVQNKIIEDLKVLKKELNYSLIGRIINGKSSNCKIEDVIDYEQPTNYIVKSDKYIENGETPVLTANKAFLLGYTIENEGVYNKSDCIILDDFTLDFKYVNFPFKIKSSAIKILTAKKDIELRYFYEYLLFLGLTSHEHKRHYISEVAPLPLYLPSIDEQRNALSVLNSISKKIKVEENYISALKAQKCFFLRAMFI